MTRPSDGGGTAITVPGDLVLVDTSRVTYLRGTWEGYLEALSRMRHNCAQAIPTAAQWQGDRADRFRSWCDAAGADLDEVEAAIRGVISSLEQFLNFAVDINTQMATAAQLVKQNVTGYWVDGNSIGGTFQLNGGPESVVIKGATLSPMYLDISQWPAWLQTVQWYLGQALRDFFSYSSSADATLTPALARFKQLHQFGHLSRSSVGPSPFGDPTWQALTGGGLIRPTAPGFQSNPFGTDLMPDWYDPTTSQKISNFIGEHEWVVDVFAIATAFVGQPEVGAAVEVLVHGVKLGIDATDGDLKDVPWDAIDLGLDAAGAGDVADDIVKQLIYIPAHAASEPVAPEVAKALTNFVQARLREAMAEAVTGPDGKAQISLSTLNAISAEAAGELQSLQAAGVAG